MPVLTKMALGLNPYAVAAVAQYLDMLPQQRDSLALMEALKLRKALQSQQQAYVERERAMAQAMLLPELATPAETIMETPLQVSPTPVPMPNALMERIMTRRAMESGLPADVVLRRNMILTAERIRMLEAARLSGLLQTQQLSPETITAVLSGAQTLPLDVGRPASEVMGYVEPTGGPSTGSGAFMDLSRINPFDIPR